MLMDFDFDSYYEISRTANFIYERNFTRVALQFPDEQLKDATKVVSALRDKVHSLRECGSEGCGDAKDVRLFVMADTTYGSCCVDEVGASHIGADSVIHYGHTCLSPTSTLPALFIFGKASINIAKCAESLSNFALTKCKPIVVLYGLEYAHAIHHIKESTFFESRSTSTTEVQYADVMTSVMDPLNGNFSSIGNLELNDSTTTNGGLTVGRNYNIGGLTWNIPEGHKMDDYMLIWIGSENPAFASVVLTFNGCDIARYNAVENCFVTEASLQRRTLKRRYFLVEKAKDANIIGILVGTLGVAGYLHMIRQMKELIAGAGKKAYTFVMGKPNPAKLANFPECDVFVYVSCAQTALLDSKEYLAPVITPFEALLAFGRESQWTGEYVMGFRDLITSPMVGVKYPSEEARFSFFQGGYVEEFQENGQEDDEGGLALAHATERALQVRDNCSKSMIERSAKSGAEFLSARSYCGLDMHNQDALPKPFFIGRTGRASGYNDEKGMLED